MSFYERVPGYHNPFAGFHIWDCERCRYFERLINLQGWVKARR